MACDFDVIKTEIEAIRGSLTAEQRDALGMALLAGEPVEVRLPGTSVSPQLKVERSKERYFVVMAEGAQPPSGWLDQLSWDTAAKAAAVVDTQGLHPGGLRNALCVVLVKSRAIRTPEHLPDLRYALTLLSRHYGYAFAGCDWEMHERSFGLR